VVGRYLGLEPLPGASGATQRVPLLAVRGIATVERATGDARWSMEGLYRMPEDALADVDDMRRVVETRPYYHLLAQAQRIDAQEPRLADSAAWPNGNNLADDLHQEPARHRGKQFYVQGTVHAWRPDGDVARDRPFGVTRAVRVVAWSRDWSPITTGRSADGKRQQQLKSVLRLFEIVLPGDQPPPRHGDRIAVTGRFLKLHATPIEPMTTRVAAMVGAPPGTDLIYTWMFVAPSYVIIPPPPPYQFHWLHAVVLGFAVVMTLGFWYMSRREAQAQVATTALLARMRTQRRAVMQREAAAAPPADTPTGQLPPPTPPPPQG
jgi:hypothetical protein